MPLLWTAISSHGYGHAAQVVPVLNELGRRRPDLRAVLRTHVPRAFFESRLTLPWELSPSHVDVGCLQHGPLTMDWPATWRAHHDFHATWKDRLHAEVSAIRQAQADLVLSNTSYLALAAGAAARLPTIALASLSWDEILRDHVDPAHPWQADLLATMRHAYADASLLLRIAPGLAMSAFSRATDIGPIASPLPADREQLRDVLGLEAHDKLILVAFGGIRLTSLPFAHMESMEGLHFLIDEPPPPGSKQIHTFAGLPLPFSTLLSSVDVIMTKPGYGTVIEAVATQTPVVYVRRYSFADEQPIVEYLQRYGRSLELSRKDFEQPRWEGALRQALSLPPSTVPPPPITGPSEAADYLESLLG